MNSIRRGRLVRVYRNLQRDEFSIQTFNLGWRVRGHARYVHLRYASFVVSEAGKGRAMRENQRNVHAYIQGVLNDVECASDFSFVPAEMTISKLCGVSQRVSYKAFSEEACFFVSESHTPVNFADGVSLSINGGVHAFGSEWRQPHNESIAA